MVVGGPCPGWTTTAGSKPATSASEVSIAGPGFINLRLDGKIWLSALAGLLGAGEDFGKTGTGRGRAVNVEP